MAFPGNEGRPKARWGAQGQPEWSRSALTCMTVANEDWQLGLNEVGEEVSGDDAFTNPGMRVKQLV